MKHVEISAYGIVQGVGFRPFVHRLAKQCALCGSVCNSGSGALIHVQGEEEDISSFLKRLEEEAPPLCRIEALECRERALCADERLSDPGKAAQESETP